MNIGRMNHDQQDVSKFDQNKNTTDGDNTIKQVQYPCDSSSSNTEYNLNDTRSEITNAMNNSNTRERRERILTLSITALIALLTGMSLNKTTSTHKIIMRLCSRH
jgi:hypothetical protein